MSEDGVTASSAAVTPYERIGGRDAVRALVDRFRRAGLDVIVASRGTRFSPAGRNGYTVTPGNAGFIRCIGECSPGERDIIERYNSRFNPR